MRYSDKNLTQGRQGIFTGVRDAPISDFDCSEIDSDRSGRGNNCRQPVDERFTILVGNKALEFREVDLTDPIPPDSI